MVASDSVYFICEKIDDIDFALRSIVHIAKFDQHTFLRGLSIVKRYFCSSRFSYA